FMQTGINQWKKECEDLKEKLADAGNEIKRLKEENQSFRNVLAVIHRDGGDYVAEHGHKKASIDARIILAKKDNEIERLKKLVPSMQSHHDVEQFYEKEPLND
ncbi:MAG: hypothetical protein IMZ53_10080, partial [Thermoplasmata archaeon]|nr:hypothetical protein [Thermoplasmata archaeon]